MENSVNVNMENWLMTLIISVLFVVAAICAFTNFTRNTTVVPTMEWKSDSSWTGGWK